MKIASVALIILLALSVAGLSYAATANFAPGNKGSGATSTPTRSHEPGMKAERGIKNLLFGWTEIPKTIIQVTRDTKNPIWGLTGGTWKGFEKAFPKTISGAADIVSFPMGDYNKVPVKSDPLNKAQAGK